MLFLTDVGHGYCEKRQKWTRRQSSLYAAVDLHGIRSSLVEGRRKETAALKIKAAAS